MEFKYQENNFGYYELIYSENRSINALCDTGAGACSIDLYSLEVLIGHKAKDILNIVNRKIASGIKIMGMNTASGRLDRVIPLELNNVRLAGRHFEKFYTYLNIDNELWKNNGFVEYNGVKQKVPAHILIGLNLLRCGELKGNSNVIKIENFNYDIYLEHNKRLMNQSINSYQLSKLLTPKLTTQEIVAELVTNMVAQKNNR